MVQILRQAGAIPFTNNDDDLRVLLITSRDTGRWVIPKGGVKLGQTALQAAEAEAYEEAGIKGIAQSTPLGIYTYGKRLNAGVVMPTTVEVFALHVTKQLKNWPERAQRRFEWMSAFDAAAAVEEPGMKLLLLRLAEIQSATGMKLV